MPPKPSNIERNAFAGVVAGAAKGSPVAASKIWHEHVQKELKYQVPREVFMPNPATVSLLPEKPTDLARELALRQDKQAESERGQLLRELAQKDPVAHAEVTTRLDRHNKVPRAKYPYPQTTSQEIGWDQDGAQGELHQREMEPYARPHTNGDITDYADKYVSSHGYNCFSTSQFKYLARTSNPKK